ncbi:MAG: hypothetical protein FWD31_14735 [Planctomycetaceae bacterium]|nr:hypothetical protein [Planctomycetaceae bacterium]
MPPRPVLQAIILADHVYEDMHSGKKVIAGTFCEMAAVSFPSKYNRGAFLFISLTEFQGKLPITIEYVDLVRNETLLEFGDIIAFANTPLETCELVVELPELPLPRPGTYAFEVYLYDVPLGSFRFVVSVGQEPE